MPVRVHVNVAIIFHVRASRSVDDHSITNARSSLRLEMLCLFEVNLINRFVSLFRIETCDIYLVLEFAEYLTVEVRFQCPFRIGPIEPKLLIYCYDKLSLVSTTHFYN